MNWSRDDGRWIAEVAELRGLLVHGDRWREPLAATIWRRGLVTSEWEHAARRGDVSSLASQLAAGADVDALDRFGQSALMLASQQGHLDAVRLLIEAGADLDKTAKFSLSATMLAVVNGHESVARALAAAGANLGTVGTGAPGFAGKSAAQLARDRGFEALARALSAPEPDADA